MEELHIGLVVDGRYQLQEYKGSGSFGEVWKAWDRQQKKTVAIKIYISLNRQGCEEFLAEYKISSGLRHENLLVTESYNTWQSRPYLTMQYCDRGAASNLVDKLKPSTDDERKIWQFIHDVAAGLAYLHGLMPDPIVHQDIKPDNVLMDNNGHFLITDLGISKRVRDTLSSQSKRAATAGATAYMGPERFSKQPAPTLASDIWSLGVSIYELAEGELPFAGMGGIMLTKGAEIPDIRQHGWSHQLNNLMQRCLAKDTWDRPRALDIALEAQKMLPPLETIDPDPNRDTNPDEKRDKIAKKETPQIHNDETDERERRDKIVIKVILFILSLLVIGITYQCITQSKERKEKTLLTTEYNTLVDDCQRLYQNNSNHTDSLLAAKHVYERIMKKEKLYQKNIVGFRGQIDHLHNDLNRALKKAAQEWTYSANILIENDPDENDFKDAISYYEKALSLYEDADIRKRYEQLRDKQRNYKRMNYNKRMPTSEIDMNNYEITK